MVPPDSEGLQPPFSRRRLHMAERIRKRRRTSFYFSKDTFSNIPTSIATHLKSESEPRQRSFEMAGVIDQNRCFGDRHMPLQFAEEQYGKLRCSGWKEPNVGKFVRLGINTGVQLATFVIHLGHRLVDCDVIRRRIAGRLYVGFLHPAVDGRSTPFDTLPLKILFGIRK